MMQMCPALMLADPHELVHAAWVMTVMVACWRMFGRPQAGNNQTNWATCIIINLVRIDAFHELVRIDAFYDLVRIDTFS